MRLRKNTIDRMIAKAKKLWGLEDWDITWEFDELDIQGSIDPTNWIEKRAVITLDEKTVKAMPRREVFLLVVHEIGHPAIMFISRTAEDWVKNLVKDKQTYDIFSEAMNSAENLVLGHLMSKVIMSKVMKL